jgi:hypothetical protein
MAQVGAWLRSLMGRYEDFNAVTAASLNWAVESLGLGSSPAAEAALLAEYRRLATFPEVKESLAALGASRPLAILSNGHPEMLKMPPVIFVNISHGDVDAMRLRASVRLASFPAGLYWVYGPVPGR